MTTPARFDRRHGKGAFLWVVLPDAGGNKRLQTLNGHCLECGYRLAWLLIHGKQVSRTISLFAWRKKLIVSVAYNR